MPDETGHTDGRGHDRADPGSTTDSTTSSTTDSTANSAHGPEALGITDIADIASFELEADELDEAIPDTEGDLDLETPEADAAEQRADALRYSDEPVTSRPPAEEIEADPADVAEQRRPVGPDDEDYR